MAEWSRLDSRKTRHIRTDYSRTSFSRHNGSASPNGQLRRTLYCSKGKKPSESSGTRPLFFRMRTRMWRWRTPCGLRSPSGIRKILSTSVGQVCHCEVSKVAWISEAQAIRPSGQARQTSMAGCVSPLRLAYPPTPRPVPPRLQTHPRLPSVRRSRIGCPPCLAGGPRASGRYASSRGASFSVSRRTGKSWSRARSCRGRKRRRKRKLRRNVWPRRHRQHSPRS